MFEEYVNPFIGTEIQPMFERSRNIFISNNNKVIDPLDYVLVKTEEESADKNIELIWKNLSFSVKATAFKTVSGLPYKVLRTEKRIINNLSGRITSGRLTAFLGPNGAGKSTLLKCLGGRKQSGLSGEISINFKGSKRNVRFSYYSQYDILLDSLTVEETLFYSLQMTEKERRGSISSQMKSESKIKTYGLEGIKNPNKKLFGVNKILNDLKLQKCSKTRVNQCSGGQRRRLSIALELIFEPSVLLMDEPTSGLDSFSTLQCIQFLKQLLEKRENPMIIAMVIHQPTAKILGYFDDLYVLSSTGQCIYEGPTIEIVERLSKFGLNCPQFHNPSDFALEIASGEQGMDVIQILAEHRLESSKHYIISKKNSTNISKIIEKTRSHGLIDQIRTIWPLSKRSFFINLKNPKQYLLQLSSVTIMLILMFVLHLENKIGPNDACLQKPSLEYLKNLLRFDFLDPDFSPFPNWAFIFYSMLFIVFISMLPTLLSFPLEIAILRKEYSNGWYSLSSYFMAKQIADLPQSFIFPVIYCFGSYILTEQIMELWRLLSFTALIILLSILTQGFGFLVSALFVDNVTASTVIGAIVNIPLLLFAGLLIKIQSIPVMFQPLTYISYFRLTFESILVLIYGFGRCEPIDKLTFAAIKDEVGDHIVPMVKCLYDYDQEILGNMTMIIDHFNVMLEKSSSFAMNAFDFDESYLYFNILLLVFYTIILRVFAYILLVWKIRGE